MDSSHIAFRNYAITFEIGNLTVQIMGEEDRNAATYPGRVNLSAHSTQRDAVRCQNDARVPHAIVIDNAIRRSRPKFLLPWFLEAAGFDFIEEPLSSYCRYF
jgi:hypothetical protein